MEKDCGICNKYKEHYYLEHLNGERMEFYELMHGNFSKHLKIPKKCTYYFRGETPETVDLKDPDDNIWPIGLKQTNEGILLQSGWKEFVEALHITDGDLLIFKYDGNQSFDVSIFGKDHCKKEAFHLFMESDCEEEKSEDSVEVLNAKSHGKVFMRNSSTTRKISREKENPASKYQRVKSNCKRAIYGTSELNGYAKKKNCNLSEPLCLPIQGLDVDAEGMGHNIKQEFVDAHNLEELISPNFYISKRRSLTREEEELALLLVHSVKPRNPCFISILPYGSVYNACFMYVPIKFQRAHLPSKHCTIYLQLPNQRKKWRSQFYVYSTMARFCWESFVVDNSLQLGDACLFQCLQNSGDVIMMVSICRAAARETD
ncbi:uncharacterized protein A4U43_C03F22800 [Asparagus officinalis]|uniref:TF-B3 domain-containing protein n=1 Tax=Asparagus officinalis TaxID=4686 RepID=A0A5P1FH78_ASPOF|nr:B3 domain-containing protein Os03g0620400-like [Asparagus officinalis]ONK76001.1 uncharacterized protein A4U43_C03F22800 [Asparagus officinalis]